MNKVAQNAVELERTVKRAKPPRQSSWKDYKNIIYELYAVQNYPIEDLMSAMAEKGLHAS